MTVFKKYGFLFLASLLLSTTLGGFANAHFLFVYSEDGKVKVVFGEGLDPDQAQFLTRLKDMKSFTTVDGQTKEIEFKKVTEGDEGDDGWFETPEVNVGEVVNIACPYGVFGRGDKSMFLDYSAKYVRYSENSQPMKPAKELTLDIVPEMVNGRVKVSTFFNGMPINNAEVKLVRVETESVNTMTDDTGSVVLSPATRYVVRVKHSIDEDGEVDGKKFSQRLFYCTMVLDVGSDSADVTAASTPVTESKAPISLERVNAGFEDFPRGMTSFGATVLDDHIYVIGGKAGKAHSYATAYQNRDVLCLSLSSEDKEWKTVGENLGLQGLAIVGHGGKIYRIGGLEARNKEGEDHDLHSIANVLEFDPADQSWKEMPSLPEGRSSFDSCVVDGKVYVVGGWRMEGEDDTEWATDMLVFDLANPDGDWKRVDAPFSTRALAVRAFNNKLIVVGGIQEVGGPTVAVHFFDLQTQAWSEGPAVPTEGNMKAFGCSAVAVGNDFLVSTYDGNVFRLNENATAWQTVHQLDNGRFFHQMLPVSDSQFALVGGSHMEHGSQNEIEVFEVSTNE